MTAPFAPSNLAYAARLWPAAPETVASHGEREIGAIDLYDKAGQLLDRLDLSGDHHSLAIDLAHIIPHLLAYPCAVVILTHRHPSGQAAPSEADIITTRAFAGLLRLLGMHLHDHVIDGSDTCFSFRETGLI